MLKSLRKAVLLSILFGAWIGACGGGSFAPSAPTNDAGVDSAIGGAAGQTGGAGGTGVAGTGAGATGASAGDGGTGATGGSAGDGGTGATGGTSGAGGTAGDGGSGGIGGAGGSGGCPPFEYCHASTTSAPSCGLCAQTVCKELPYCCEEPWDALCALKAQTLGECQCAGLVCSPLTFPTSSEGVCVSDNAFCNPLVSGPKCGSLQCGVNADSSQLQFQCTAIGTVPPCANCNPSASASCGAGLSCIGGICVRVCCNDEDCGGNAVCAPGLLPGSYDGLGICRRS